MKRIWIAAVLAVSLTANAAAQHPSTLTLSCSGTYAFGNANPVPSGALGLIVGNGVISFMWYTPVRIISTTQTEIDFDGNATSTGIAGITTKSEVSGSVDRVTGLASITVTTLDYSGKNARADVFNLTCRPARQMF